MYGVGLLAASLILAIMILPFIVSISREALLAVPREQREAALAVGATRWEATWQVVVPYARLGIVGSIFLALARALGETMAVTMVIGNDPRISASLFAPGYSIAAVIANEFTEATSELHVSALIELGLVLFVLTILMNGVARLLIARPRGREAPRDARMYAPQGRQRAHVRRHGAVHPGHGLGAVLHPGLPGLERRPIDQLGFLHPVAQAGRRSGRGHGQRDRRQREDLCSWRR